MRYLLDFRLPDKALDLVDQACAVVRFRTLTPQGVEEEGEWGETPHQRPGARRASHAPNHHLVVGRDEIAADEGARLMALEDDLMEEHSYDVRHRQLGEIMGTLSLDPPAALPGPALRNGKPTP